jgi:hypothetical protein
MDCVVFVIEGQKNSLPARFKKDGFFLLSGSAGA